MQRPSMCLRSYNITHCWGQVNCRRNGYNKPDIRSGKIES